ncbi:unnamed protein product, partial [Durusdinium trenchii]
MDIKYLQERYQKGKVFVTDFMNKAHRCPGLPLSQAHADLLQHQRDAERNDRLTIMVLDASLWPRRPLHLDEAIEVAKTISNGDAAAVLFVLLPLAHGSTDKETVMKNKRILEDKVLSVLEFQEVTLTFSDSQHAGDRRRRSQSCLLAVSPIHKNFAFIKSKAYLGTIGPVARARVMDLWTDDDARVCSPPGRAQQRGAEATKQVLQGLVDGLERDHANASVYVVDLMPSRYGEWSRAVWSMQLEKLKGTAQSDFDWHFVGYMTPEDGGSDDWTSYIGSQIHQDYWDTCDDAGPPTRPQAAFTGTPPTMELCTIGENNAVVLPDAMLAGLASSGESLLAKVKAFNHSHDTAILTNFRSPSSTPQTPSRPGRGVARTMAQPVFDSPNAPMNLSQMGVPVQLLPLEDFHSTIELVSHCGHPVHNQLRVCIAKDLTIWLLNEGDAPLEVESGELFGYNIGSSTEKGIGVARTSVRDAIPFIVEADHTMMAFVDSDGKKTGLCFAQIACRAAQKSGTTELVLCDHDLTQQVDTEGNVKPFRYTVAPKAKVNVFDPKPLESGLDPMAARYSQMGAHFIGKFHQLSCAPTALCKMLWE